MTPPEQAFLTAIEAFPKFGSGVCLERIDASLQRLDLLDYIHNCRKVVVTGTNGKGSTAKLINQIAGGFGYTAGLFTSPHFLAFNDRFQVAGENVAYSELEQARQVVMATVAEISATLDEEFGLFELLFLVALSTFQRQQCDFLVFEAGIGGRYDPVRTLNARHTVLTSVDLEHCDVLGNSTELIALDKLDACYHGGTVVLGNLPSSLKRKLTAYGSRRQITCIDNHIIATATAASCEIPSRHPKLLLPSGEAVAFTTEMVDFFAQENAKTALALSETLFQQYPSAQRAQVYTRALGDYRNPGRLSYLSRSPAIIVDSAHTDAAFAMLFRALRQELGERKPICLVGLSADKNPTQLVPLLCDFAAACVVSSATVRGAEPTALHAALVANSLPSTAVAEVPAALQLALDQAQRRQTSVLVCGSVFFAAEVTKAFHESKGQSA